MPAELFWENACIHNTEAFDTMHLALHINNTCGRRWAHARCADWMIKCKCLFLHEANQVLVRDVVDVAAGVRPPVRRRVIIHRDWLEELLEGWASNSETDTQACQ